VDRWQQDLERSERCGAAPPKPHLHDGVPVVSLVRFRSRPRGTASGLESRDAGKKCTTRDAHRHLGILPSTHTRPVYAPQCERLASLAGPRGLKTVVPTNIHLATEARLDGYMRLSKGETYWTIAGSVERPDGWSLQAERKK